MIAGVVGTVQVLIPLEGVVDIEALRTKLQRDLTKVESEIVSLTQRLANTLTLLIKRRQTWCKASEMPGQKQKPRQKFSKIG